MIELYSFLQDVDIRYYVAISALLALYPFSYKIFQSLVRVYFILFSKHPTVLESVKLNNVALSNEASKSKQIIAVKDYLLEIEIVVNDHSKTWLLIDGEKLFGQKFVIHNQNFGHFRFEVLVAGRKGKIHQAFSTELIPVEVNSMENVDRSKIQSYKSRFSFSMKNAKVVSVGSKAATRIDYKVYHKVKPNSFKTRIATPKRLTNTLFK